MVVVVELGENGISKTPAVSVVDIDDGFFPLQSFMKCTRKLQDETIIKSIQIAYQPEKSALSY